MSHEGVWQTTADEIAEHYTANYYDQAVAHHRHMYDDGAPSGRLLVLNLHPWLIGQPFRIGYLDAALGAMMRRQGVGSGIGSEIVDWYRLNPPVE